MIQATATGGPGERQDTAAAPAARTAARSRNTARVGLLPGVPGRHPRTRRQVERDRQGAQARGAAQGRGGALQDRPDRAALPQPRCGAAATGGAGRDAVVARIREGMALFDRTVHLGGSTAVALDGDRATARAAQLSTHALADPPGELFVSGGHADTELVRTPDGWRIAATALRIAWTRGTPPRLPAAAAPGDTI